MTTNDIAFEGRIHRPGDEDYEEARLPWQRRFDPRPEVILDAASPEDVQAAVRYAGESGLPLAVQATGHGAVVPADGAVLLRTAALDGGSVDPQARTATVQAGTLWSEVIAAAAPHGLAPLSGSSAGVGVVGYTVGGGAGWLSRKYGYAADSVIRARVVTADGELVTASADENPDLFWALRGGGGNFGIVTELEFRLHEAPRVVAGMQMFEADRAADALTLYREWAPQEPDESNSAFLVMQVPPVPQMPEAVRGRRVLAFRAMYLGGKAEADQVWAPLRDAAGPALLDSFAEMGFGDTATALGPPPPPMAGEMQMELFDAVPDSVIGTIASAHGVSAVELRHWGGAMARRADGDGPTGHRGVPFSVAVSAMAPAPDQLGPGARAVADVVRRIRPHATGGSFLNFVGDPDGARAAYTAEDYARLTAVKRAYDPENRFRLNPNIPPAG